MQIPTNFTVFPNDQKGDVYGTEFEFVATLPSGYTAFAWNFGDGVFSYKSTATHIYNYPGIYTVGLSAWTDYGLIYTDAATIDVDYVYRDTVMFSTIPDVFGTPGLPTDVPFTVSLTSAKIDQPLSIILQPFNTKSVPHYAIPEKWRFLTPKWRFVDASTNKILDGPLLLSSVPIYKDSKLVAVKAEATFYYIDDLSTGTDPSKECPLLIAATLSTERFSYPPESLIYPYASYSNSEVARAIISWQINDIVPTKLKVSDNFLNEVFPVKWSNVPIPVMITCVSDTSLLDSFADTVSYSTAALSYPRTNELGSAAPVIISLSSDKMSLVKDVHYNVDDNIYFKATDEYDNVASGYIFTTITPLSPLPGSTVVAVSTVATNQIEENQYSFRFPVGYPISSNVYVSHPSKSTINRINITTYPTDCTSINYYKDLGILVEGVVSFINVPTLTSTDLVNYTLSGTAAVYGMAFNPVKSRLYTCDADQNIISMYSSGTTLMSSVQLSSTFLNEVLAPSYISVDANSNLWVSLFDDNKLIKLDSNLNYLLSAAPSPSNNFMSLDGELGFLVQENGDLLISDVPVTSENLLFAPPIVETDMDNNVWACYPSFFDSILVKFDSNGNELFKAESFPDNSVPVSLAINVTNGVWAACKNTNSIMEYDTNGTLVTTVSGFLRPSYIAMDRSNNVWVAHGYDFCSVYDTRTAEVSTWRISTIEQTITRVFDYTSADVAKSLDEDEIWGGLSTDVYDRVWIIDSVNNAVFAFSPTDPTNFTSFNIVPYADTQYIIKAGDDFVSNIPANNIRSAQAGGDWTGNRWYQKYGGAYNSLRIKGNSAPFTVYDLDDSFQLTKVNEEFDCSAYFKSLALPEVLSRNTKIFDEFFAAVAGDGNPTKESAGRVIYERIANFVSTRGDFETAEIDELLSIAAEMSVDVKTFGSNFPVAINRLLSIFSVPKQQLRGVPNLEADVMNNVGPILTQYSLITADQYYFLKDRSYGDYQLVYANPLSGNVMYYPLDQIEVEGLRLPITDNYYFFMYNEQNSNGYVGNLINWDSKHTTVSYNLSTNEEWYGDGGLVETMFNNLLTKQLYQQ